jgi:hypothetical protein
MRNVLGLHLPDKDKIKFSQKMWTILDLYLTDMNK